MCHDDLVVAENHNVWVSRIASALRTGTPLDLLPGEAADVTSSDPWPQERWIPASALRAALLTVPTDADPRGLTVRGACVEGRIDLDHALVSVSVTLDQCVLDGGLSGQDCRFKSLSILSSRSGPIDLDDSQIDGVLSLYGTKAPEVMARRATVHGQLRLNGATLSNPDGDALNLDGIDVKGDLFAGDGFTATGEVRGLGMTVGGQLNLDGATLMNPGGDALSLDEADIKGSMFARRKFSATGGVRGPGMTVGGQLDLNGATLMNPPTKRHPDRHALNLNGANIKGDLWLRDISMCQGTLNLTACAVGVLVVGKGLEELPPLASAAGWRVRDISGHLRHDRAAAIKWLDTSSTFTASPWEEIARLYDRNGQPADARRVRFAAAHRTARHAPWRSKPIRWFYALTVGYGYYPLLAAVWLAVAVLAATVLTAAFPAAFLPTGVNARASNAITQGADCPSAAELLTAATDAKCRTPGYPELKPFTYALATVSPASAIAQPAWAPLAPGAALLEVGLTALKLFGWILTALLLAGLTGLLRKG